MFTDHTLMVATSVIDFFGVVEFVPGSDSLKFQAVASDSLVAHLKALNGLYYGDACVDPDHPLAEKHALCLAHLGRHREAEKIFTTIVEGSSLILLVDKAPERKGFYSEATANCCGKLGYLGLFQYALSCEVLGKTQKASSLLSVILNQIPAKCNPCGLSDVRLRTVEKLIDFGVESICGKNLKQELALTKQDNP